MKQFGTGHHFLSEENLQGVAELVSEAIQDKGLEGRTWRIGGLRLMPHDPQLAELMRAVLRGRPGIVEKKVGRFMFRVGKVLEAEALARAGASPMDITGKPMKGFVWLQADKVTGKALRSWIDLAARRPGTRPG